MKSCFSKWFMHVRALRFIDDTTGAEDEIRDLYRY